MGGGTTSGGTYHVNAYAATDPSKVHVFVSLRAKMVYVMEGDRALMVTPTSIGTPQAPTPTGHFAVTAKDPTKRSGEYGFWTNGSDITPAARVRVPAPASGYRVGYPMANWVEFAPGYGFHEGYVWPIPRSHGCLRIHKNASVKFFKLVQIGTPVTIASSACQRTTPSAASRGAPDRLPHPDPVGPLAS